MISEEHAPPAQGACHPTRPVITLILEDTIT
jgi:hypothetical protein